MCNVLRSNGQRGFRITYYGGAYDGDTNSSLARRSSVFLYQEDRLAPTVWALNDYMDRGPDGPDALPWSHGARPLAALTLNMGTEECMSVLRAPSEECDRCSRNMTDRSVQYLYQLMAARPQAQQHHHHVHDPAERLPASWMRTGLRR